MPCKYILSLDICDRIKLIQDILIANKRNIINDINHRNFVSEAWLTDDVNKYRACPKLKIEIGMMIGQPLRTRYYCPDVFEALSHIAARSDFCKLFEEYIEQYNRHIQQLADAQDIESNNQLPDIINIIDKFFDDFKDSIDYPGHYKDLFTIATFYILYYQVYSTRASREGYLQMWREADRRMHMQNDTLNRDIERSKIKQQMLVTNILNIYTCLILLLFDNNASKFFNIFTLSFIVGIFATIVLSCALYGLHADFFYNNKKMWCSVLFLVLMHAAISYFQFNYNIYIKIMIMINVLFILFESNKQIKEHYFYYMGFDIKLKPPFSYIFIFFAPLLIALLVFGAPVISTLLISCPVIIQIIVSLLIFSFTSAIAILYLMIVFDILFGYFRIISKESSIYHISTLVLMIFSQQKQVLLSLNSYALILPIDIFCSVYAIILLLYFFWFWCTYE